MSHEYARFANAVLNASNHEKEQILEIAEAKLRELGLKPEGSLTAEGDDSATWGQLMEWLPCVAPPSKFKDPAPPIQHHEYLLAAHERNVAAIELSRERARAANALVQATVATLKPDSMGPFTYASPPDSDTGGYTDGPK